MVIYYYKSGINYNNNNIFSTIIYNIKIIIDLNIRSALYIIFII